MRRLKSLFLAMTLPLIQITINGCSAAPSALTPEPTVKCDRTTDVVLNGVSISKDRITRNSAGCIVSIDLSEMGMTDPECLSGIENYCLYLERLSLDHNNLADVNISYLAGCPSLEVLRINDNMLLNIDVSTLLTLPSLDQLHLNGNMIPECAEVCRFRKAKGTVSIWTDCSCGN